MQQIQERVDEKRKYVLRLEKAHLATGKKVHGEAYDGSPGSRAGPPGVTRGAPGMMQVRVGRGGRQVFNFLNFVTELDNYFDIFLQKLLFHHYFYQSRTSGQSVKCR